MLAPSVLKSIADVCTGIADEVADDTGFVSMRRLVARFQARLLIKPMLVEGMLATIQDGDEPASSSTAWVVLVDAETYRVCEQDVESETPDRPLPNRLRNTIAHELLHSLAFRPSEFGILLRRRQPKSETPFDWVRAIEEETESLTPLLLWPQKAVHELLRHKREPVSVDELADVRRSVRVSRHVLINRLSILQRVDPAGFLTSAGLRNLAVGLAEWCDGRRSVVRSWPLFANFDRNLLPLFVREISNQDRSPAEAVFPNESFLMCGGGNRSVELSTAAGTRANPRAKDLRVEVSAEVGDRKPGSEFLFVARIPSSETPTIN